MSRGNSSERARMMRALGAEVELVDQAPGSPTGQVSGADLAQVEVRTREINRRSGRIPRRPVPAPRHGYVVEPAGAAVLAGERPTAPNPPHPRRGYSMPALELLDRDLVTGYLTVTDDEAIASARELAVHEGIFAGFSTGACVAAALSLDLYD